VSHQDGEQYSSLDEQKKESAVVFPLLSPCIRPCRMSCMTGPMDDNTFISRESHRDTKFYLNEKICGVSADLGFRTAQRVGSSRYSCCVRTHTAYGRYKLRVCTYDVSRTAHHADDGPSSTGVGVDPLVARLQRSPVNLSPEQIRGSIS
jgi:hypothetical protein